MPLEPMTVYASGFRTGWGWLSGATAEIVGMGSSARRSPAAWPDSRQRSSITTRPLGPGTEQELVAAYRSVEQAAEASGVLIVTLPLTTRSRHLLNAGLIGAQAPWRVR